MTAPTHHTITGINRFGNAITAPVVNVHPLGDGWAEVHIESDFYIEAGHAHPAIYATPGHEAKGNYTVTTPLKDSQFTERQTYIYKGTFERADGKFARARVIYLQPKAERWRQVSVVVLHLSIRSLNHY